MEEIGVKTASALEEQQGILGELSKRANELPSPTVLEIKTQLDEASQHVSDTQKTLPSIKIDREELEKSLAETNKNRTIEILDEIDAKLQNLQGDLSNQKKLGFFQSIFQAIFQSFKTENSQAKIAKALGIASIELREKVEHNPKEALEKAEKLTIKVNQLKSKLNDTPKAPTINQQKVAKKSDPETQKTTITPH